MLRVVVDVNVWVSALLNPGNAERVASAFKRGEFELYYPQQLIDDLRRVTAKRKLIRRIQEDALSELIDFLERDGNLVQPEEIVAVSRDPDDDIYLACVQLARCQYLVTGDADLLTLKRHGQTRIITPAEFLSVLEHG